MEQGTATAQHPNGRPSAGHAAATFVLCAIAIATALVGSDALLNLFPVRQPNALLVLASPAVHLLVLFSGLFLVARLRVPELRALSALGLVRRPSASREAGLGAALGWALAIALVLPGVLTLHMHSSLLLDSSRMVAAGVSTLALLLFVAARQLALCGLPLRSLTQATSPLFAAVCFAGLAALLAVTTAHADGAEALLAAMAQLVFSLAAGRTRAIWLGTALQLLWGVGVTILFGLPSFLWPPAVSVVRSSMSGSRWVTGDGFGPEAAIWAGVVTIAALVLVWRVTRDYAWHYTFDPIAAAGYPMDVAPPAEHTRMEQALAAPAPLVHIAGVTQPGGTREGGLESQGGV